MHRTATCRWAVALLMAGIVGGFAAVAAAQMPARPDPQQRAPAGPATRMPDPDALRTPPPPAIGEMPAIPAPAGLPEPSPRTATPALAAPAQTAPQPSAPIGETLRVLFAKSAADLPGDAAPGIDALAARMAATGAGRIQITAFAQDPDVREARRLSLARAEAVRSRFVERGVRSDRINLRPLGDAKGDGPADRADIQIVN